MAAGFEPGEFAQEFQQFVTGMNRLVPPRSSPIRQLLVDHLGRDPDALPVLSEPLESAEHPNVQLALDELAAPGGWRVVGLSLGLRQRGLLLYGPPGTGKTWLVTYLRRRMTERTTVVINGGPGIHGLGQAVAVARSLQPAMVVVEDVDLIANERTMAGQDTNTVLFQLLNEMDGLGEDSDVIFVLTTNRVELLEPALAMRPGRIDQAVEIGLPDDDCRARLFELYLRELPKLDVDIDLAPLVAATEGVSAAFIRKLTRRAVLLAAAESGDPSAAPRVGSRHLTRALSALDSATTPIRRTLLGAHRVS
jgi:cell division protease FtsH